MRKVTLPPARQEQRWFNALRERVGDGPFALQGYSRAALPDATLWEAETTDNAFTGLIFVYDAQAPTSGPTVAFSDGTNWIDLQTGAAV